MFRLISKKHKALEQGYNSYNILKNYISSSLEQKKVSYGTDCTPCYTPKKMLDLLYSSSQYKDFVVNSLVLKKICTKLSIIKTLITFAVTVILIGLFSYLNLIVIGIILAIIFDIIFLLKFKSGKTYQQYYNETMSKILLMSVNEYTITEHPSNQNVADNFINKHLDVHYTKISSKYNYKFESKYEIGDDFELELIDTIETKDSEGNTITKEETVFDGFSIISKNKQPHKVLNNSIIQIRDDQNMLSELLEDTVNSIVQNKREFSFNSEKLNKHLDCKLARTGFNSDVAQKMFEVTKIITPAFEEKLLFLDERYNAFNMNISDTEFSFTVNMKKDTYQKFKNGELFKFTSNYKDKKLNTNLFADVNFEYSKLYYMLERLFLHKYFRIIYNYQMDSTRFNNYENEKIIQFENEIKDIMNIPWKEFSETNKNFVTDLKETIKETYSSL